MKRAKLYMVAAGLSLLFSGASHATLWTDWTRANGGINGTALGDLDGIQVSYSGEVNRAVTGGSSTIWNPESTYVGGSVDTSPDSVGDYIGLRGGSGMINFSDPVENPVFAIWSLGQPGFQASFTFDMTPTFEVGGPNSIYGGGAISVSGNTVSGFEGNGIVSFSGLVSSISFSHTPENWYAFTVGMNGPEEDDNSTSVTEPGTLILFLSGLLGLVGFRRYVRK